ncbi:Organic solute transporter subunit alpha [Armadillidium nasatum]|uniref:Organic solute transporter subunit alpha n=1 Tax=Armadillidium nasatum TaxID=96803 RepID=A0A5N5TJW6_9CRUS|nr:Organic solute transporter subunit alpha [Armadillidium nasatum]
MDVEDAFQNLSLCMTYIPTTQEYYDALGWIWILFVIAGCGTCLLLYCLFVEQVVFAAQSAHHVYRNSLIWIASVFYDPYDTRISKFTDLTVLMYGSEEVMLWRMKDDNIKLNKLPLCCFFSCIKPIKMTKKKLRFIIAGVQQLPYSQCFYLIMVMILQAANQVVIGSLDPAGTYFWLDSFSVTSSLMGVYFLNVLSSASFDYLKRYNYSRLSFVMSALILLTKFQSLLFSILAYYGAFPCIPPISHYVYKETVENCFYIIEMLIFGLYSYRIYRKIPFDTANPTVVRTDLQGITLPHYESYVPSFENPYSGRGLVFPTDDNLEESEASRDSHENEFFSRGNRESVTKKCLPGKESCYILYKI